MLACSYHAWCVFIHKHDCSSEVRGVRRRRTRDSDICADNVWPVSLSEWARLLSVRSERKATWMRRDRWSKWLPSVNKHQGHVVRASGAGLWVNRLKYQYSCYFFQTYYFSWFCIANLRNPYHTWCTQKIIVYFHSVYHDCYRCYRVIVLLMYFLTKILERWASI